MPKPSKKSDDFEPTEDDKQEEIEEEEVNDDDNESDMNSVNEDDESDNEEELIGDDEDDILVNTDEDDDIVTSQTVIVPNNERMTRPFLTKYEKVRIIGTRRKQLYLGAKPMIKIDGDLSIEEIVDLELKEKVIPFKIKRPLPSSNKVEIWKLSELEIIN